MKSVVPVDLTSLMMPPCSTTKSRSWSPGGDVTNVGSENAPIGLRSSTGKPAFLAPPFPTTASNTTPSASAASPTRVPLIAKRIRPTGGWAKRDPRSRDGGGHELLEPRHELLALAQEPSLRDDPRAHALLDALDENAILGANLAIEREQLVDPGEIGVRREEVIEEARRALRPRGQQRPDREVRCADEDVDPEVGPDEMELRLPLLPVPGVREL